MPSYRKYKTKGGKIRYQAIVRVAGHKPDYAVFPSMQKARKWAVGREGELIERRYDPNCIAKEKTVADMIDTYCENTLPTKSISKAYGVRQMRVLQWWSMQIGHIILFDLSASHLVQCRDKIIKKTSNATARNYIAIFNIVLQVAVNEWEWLQQNPLKTIRRPSEPDSRVRWLRKQERDRLLRSCKVEKKKPLYVIVLVALCTGARKNEILSLRWENLDLTHGSALLYETKNREPRLIGIKGLALDVLRDYAKLRRNRNGLVFAKRSGGRITIDKEFRAAVQRARVKDFRFHDLRHTCASYLAMSGATLNAIAEILGHKTLNMVKRYAHLSQSYKLNDIEVMANKFITFDEGDQ